MRFTSIVALALTVAAAAVPFAYCATFATLPTAFDDYAKQVHTYATNANKGYHDLIYNLPAGAPPPPVLLRRDPRRASRVNRRPTYYSSARPGNARLGGFRNQHVARTSLEDLNGYNMKLQAFAANLKAAEASGSKIFMGRDEGSSIAKRRRLEAEELLVRDALYGAMSKLE